MGIKQLLKNLRTAGLCREKHVRLKEEDSHALVGCNVALDLKSYLYRLGYIDQIAQKQVTSLRELRADIEGFTDRVTTMVLSLQNDCKLRSLSCVCEGWSVPQKDAEKKRRRSSRLFHNKNDWREHSIDEEITLRLVTKLNQAKVKVIRAPFEADGQLAQMCESGECNAVITEDSDLTVLLPFSVFFVSKFNLDTLTFTELYRPIIEIDRTHILTQKTRKSQPFIYTVCELFEIIGDDENILRYAIVQLSVLLGSDYSLLKPTVFGCRTTCELCSLFVRAWEMWTRHSRKNSLKPSLPCSKLLHNFCNRQFITALQCRELIEPLTQSVCALMHPKVWSMDQQNIVHLRNHLRISDDFGLINDIGSDNWRFLGDTESIMRECLSFNGTAKMISNDSRKRSITSDSSSTMSMDDENESQMWTEICSLMKNGQWDCERHCRFQAKDKPAKQKRKDSLITADKWKPSEKQFADVKEEEKSYLRTPMISLSQPAPMISIQSSKKRKLSEIDEQSKDPTKSSSIKKACFKRPRRISLSQPVTKSELRECREKTLNNQRLSSSMSQLAQRQQKAEQRRREQTKAEEDRVLRMNPFSQRMEKKERLNRKRKRLEEKYAAMTVEERVQHRLKIEQRSQERRDREDALYSYEH